MPVVDTWKGKVVSVVASPTIAPAPAFPMTLVIGVGAGFAALIALVLKGGRR